MKRLVLVAMGLQGLVGCVTEGVICTEIAVTSVNVNVRDAYGAPLSGATVTYAEEGGAPVACDDLGGGVFACGTELAGHLAVHVEAPGYGSFDQVVPVSENECHVVPQTLDVVLDRDEPCGDDVDAPSMHVTVASAYGEDLEGVRVLYANTATDAMPVECEMAGPTEAYCGWNEMGEFLVIAMARGYERAQQIVRVDADECMAITQEVSFELYPKVVPDEEQPPEDGSEP